jgi:hypothetical protein
VISRGRSPQFIIAIARAIFFNDAKLAGSEYRKDRGYSLAQRLRIALENFRNEAAQDRSGKTQKDQSGS